MLADTILEENNCDLGPCINLIVRQNHAGKENWLNTYMHMCNLSGPAKNASKAACAEYT